MGEINDVRIFAPGQDIASWQSLFEEMEVQGLIEIIQKPDKFYEVRGSEKLKRGYFKIKLLRSGL
ncbi:hypothetical protein NIES4073_00800 (plasmid) [Kalymmatonema gypsitolerans NIES-4073]|nr:hypothetical protein CI594_14555 [Fischerella thermalis CCMEE 5196]BAZ19210.1 hypothetical protein NIES4073_00800 [Scytonema sp. NIES-4073]